MYLLIIFFSMTILYVVLGVIALGVLWVIFAYNGFITLRNRVKEAWADIDVQLKRRYDLIPNLVSAVKGYAKHEEGVFTKVTEARTQAMSASGAGAQGKAENMLSETLKSLFAIAEAYPELKANENFIELQKELTDTENKIQAARRFYNTVVKDFITALQVFPGNVIAGMFHFEVPDFFELGEGDTAAKDPVKVSF